MGVANMGYKYENMQKYLTSWLLKHTIKFYLLMMPALMNRADVQVAS